MKKKADDEFCNSPAFFSFLFSYDVPTIVSLPISCYFHCILSEGSSYQPFGSGLRLCSQLIYVHRFTVPPDPLQIIEQPVLPVKNMNDYVAEIH